MLYEMVQNISMCRRFGCWKIYWVLKIIKNKRRYYSLPVLIFFVFTQGFETYSPDPFTLGDWLECILPSFGTRHLLPKDIIDVLWQMPFARLIGFEKFELRIGKYYIYCERTR